MPRAARLRAARDFEACRAPSFRASARWLNLSARIGEKSGDGGAAPVRIGVTVGKRKARKSVQRNMVKRMVREAARVLLPRLERAAAGRRVDVVVRMKAEFPSAELMPLVAFRRGLRAEADRLLLQLAEQLGLLAQG